MKRKEKNMLEFFHTKLFNTNIVEKSYRKEHVSQFLLRFVDCHPRFFSSKSQRFFFSDALKICQVDPKGWADVVILKDSASEAGQQNQRP